MIPPNMHARGLGAPYVSSRGSTYLVAVAANAGAEFFTVQLDPRLVRAGRYLMTQVAGAANPDSGIITPTTDHVSAFIASSVIGEQTLTQQVTSQDGAFVTGNNQVIVTIPSNIDTQFVGWYDLVGSTTDLLLILTAIVFDE